MPSTVLPLFSGEGIHLGDAFHSNAVFNSNSMHAGQNRWTFSICVQIAHFLSFVSLFREELVAEYLKQNPEQGLGETDDQGGERGVAGSGEHLLKGGVHVV